MTQSKFCFHVRCKIHYIFKFQTILRMEWCQVGPYCLFLHSSTFAKQSCMDAISSRGSRWRQKQDVRIPIGYGKSSAWMYHLTQTLIFLTWALTEIILVFLLKRQKKNTWTTIHHCCVRYTSQKPTTPSIYKYMTFKTNKLVQFWTN
jgi:hypothetical protein